MEARRFCHHPDGGEATILTIDGVTIIIEQTGVNEESTTVIRPDKEPVTFQSSLVPRFSTNEASVA